MRPETTTTGVMSGQVNARHQDDGDSFVLVAADMWQAAERRRLAIGNSDGHVAMQGEGSARG